MDACRSRPGRGSPPVRASWGWTSRSGWTSSRKRRRGSTRRPLPADGTLGLAELVLAVQELDAHAVGRVDERDAGRGVEVGRLQAEGHAFLPEAVAEGVEVAR